MGAPKKKAGPNRPINIKQVAELANVSVATVSRALQSPDIVAEATRKRVQAAVDDLGYRPNIQARNLRTSRTGLIIVMVSNIANPFFAEVIHGIETIAHQNGYSILLGDVRESMAREKAYLDLMASRQADGVISLVPRPPERHAGPSVPLVTSCAYVADPGITSVFVENERAARGATDYLISIGHREIGFILGWSFSPNSTEREAGYRDAMQAAGLEVRPGMVAPGDFSIESGLRGADRLMIQNPNLTAIFCANDEMALGAMRAVKMRGLRIPEDMSIVGFDGIHYSQYFDPPLTTVATPMRELGEEPMRLLLDMLADPTVPALKRALPTSLVVRESTGMPRKGPIPGSRRRS